jgi:hypothetical protein
MTAPAPTEAARSAAAQPLPEPRHRDLRDMANALRALAMDAVEQAKSGHPGMPMGMADVATVLFRDFLKFDAADPDWPDRDRYVLSAGHGSMLLYGLLHLTGYSASASSAAAPPVIPNMAMRKASKRRPGRLARVSAMPSAWRSPNACWRHGSAPRWSTIAPM